MNQYLKFAIVAICAIISVAAGQAQEKPAPTGNFDLGSYYGSKEYPKLLTKKFFDFFFEKDFKPEPIVTLPNGNKLLFEYSGSSIQVGKRGNDNTRSIYPVIDPNKPVSERRRALVLVERPDGYRFCGVAIISPFYANITPEFVYGQHPDKTNGFYCYYNIDGDFQQLDYPKNITGELYFPDEQLEQIFPANSFGKYYESLNPKLPNGNKSETYKDRIFRNGWRKYMPIDPSYIDFMQDHRDKVIHGLTLADGGKGTFEYRFSFDETIEPAQVSRYNSMGKRVGFQRMGGYKVNTTYFHSHPVTYHYNPETGDLDIHFPKADTKYAVGRTSFGLAKGEDPYEKTIFEPDRSRYEPVQGREWFVNWIQNNRPVEIYGTVKRWVFADSSDFTTWMVLDDPDHLGPMAFQCIPKTKDGKKKTGHWLNTEKLGWYYDLSLHYAQACWNTRWLPVWDRMLVKRRYDREYGDASRAFMAFMKKSLDLGNPELPVVAEKILADPACAHIKPEWIKMITGELSKNDMWFDFADTKRRDPSPIANFNRYLCDIDTTSMHWTGDEPVENTRGMRTPVKLAFDAIVNTQNGPRLATVKITIKGHDNHLGKYLEVGGAESMEYEYRDFDGMAELIEENKNAADKVYNALKSKGPGLKLGKLKNDAQFPAYFKPRKFADVERAKASFAKSHKFTQDVASYYDMRDQLVALMPGLEAKAKPFALEAKAWKQCMAANPIAAEIKTQADITAVLERMTALVDAATKFGEYLDGHTPETALPADKNNKARANSVATPADFKELLGI